MKRALAYLLVATLVACGSSDDSLTTILGKDKGHFRGVSIGDKHDKVLKITAAHVVTDNEAGIYCEYDFEEISVSTRYEFDGEELYSIQADIFFPDSSAMNQFESNLKEKYDNSYGEMSENGGFFVWQEKNQVEFTLANESIEFGQPKLSLTIYNFGY